MLQQPQVGDLTPRSVIDTLTTDSDVDEYSWGKFSIQLSTSRLTQHKARKGAVISQAKGDPLYWEIASLL